MSVWEGKQCDTRQDPEREPSQVLAPSVGQEHCELQSLVLRVLSKLEKNITGQKSQEWEK